MSPSPAPGDIAAPLSVQGTDSGLPAGWSSVTTNMAVPMLSGTL